MFDINTLINEAIAKAVDARLVPLMETHANVVGELARRIAKLEGQIAAQERGEFSERQTDAFVNHLNNQEWFWNKVNAYVDRHIADGEYLDKDDFQDLFDRAIEDVDLEHQVRAEVRQLTFTVEVD